MRCGWIESVTCVQAVILGDPAGLVAGLELRDKPLSRVYVTTEYLIRTIDASTDYARVRIRVHVELRLHDGVVDVQDGGRPYSKQRFASAIVRLRGIPNNANQRSG